MLLLVLKRLDESIGERVDPYRPEPTSSSCGGGVVSAELISLSCGSDDPEAAGEEASLSMAGPSTFIATSTDAASNSWTC